MANEGERVEIRALFDRVRGAPREQWEALLDAERLAGTGPEVIAGVRHLLGFVTAGPAALTGDIPTALVEQRARVERLAADAMPAQIGRYRIVRVLGEGGMGTVYEAQQESPRRTVALKVIRAGYLSGQMLRRFEHESHVLGRLQHSGIAQVYEAGTVQDERGNPMPFFAMEFIKGVPLTDYAGQKNLGTRERLDLIARVCDAVYHAHQKGVIHRDLKPANILVDESGQPKVLDFGVARATDSDLQATTVRTDIGQLVGTVPYMSPEQVGGDPDDLDTRSDVYALGVIAYELLAGRRPYDLQKKLIHEAARIIKEEEPTRLSSINRTLRGDVETIVAKALEKDKARRYQSAESLAGDIRHYLKDEPIAARPASTWYQLSKFSRRNKGLVAGVTVAFLALTLGLAGTVWKAIEAQRERDFAKAETLRANDRAVAAARAEESARAAEAEQRRLAVSEAEQRRAAETQRDKAEKIAEFMSDTLEGAGPSVALGRDITMLKELMDTAAARIENGDLKDAPEAELHLRGTIGNTYRELAVYDAAQRILEPALALARRLHAGDHEATASALDNLASLLMSCGDISGAEPLYRESLDMVRRLFPGDSPEVATGLNNVGNMLHNRGDLAGAERVLRESLEMRKRLFPDDHPHVALGLNNLAELLRARGDLVGAEPLYNESLDMHIRLFQGDHPQVATGLDNLAQLLYARGDLPGAERRYRESLEMRKRLFPGDSVEVATSLNNLAQLLQTRGDLAGAEPLFHEALDMWTRLYPGDHPSVATGLSNLASLLQARGDLAGAEPLAYEALDMLKRLFPGDHPNVATGLNNLAGLLQDHGNLEGAEARFLESLEMRKRLFQGDHPSVATSLNNYARVLQARGDLTSAESRFVESLEMRKRLFPGDHPSVATSLNNLALLFYVRGDVAAAEPLCREALEMRRRVLSPNHPNTRTSLFNTAELLEALAKHAEAEQLWRELQEMCAATLPAEDWRIPNAISRLGGSLLAQNKFAPAEPLLIEGFEGLGAAKDTPRKPADRLREGCERVVKLYESWDKAEPGKGYDAKVAAWKARLDALPAPAAPPASAEPSAPK